MLSNKGLIAGAVMGGILLFIGGISFPVLEKIIHYEIVKNVIISNNDTFGYNSWQDPPGHIYQEVWFFTLANKAEVIEGGKPILIEKGPYTFRLTIPKGNIAYNLGKGTVNYTTLTTYFFDREHSVGDMEDKITTVNIPLLSMVEILKYINPELLQIVINALATFENEEMFSEYTVRDLLWGYEDPILKLINRLLPSLVPDAHFGFFYGLNETESEVYEINDGSKDIMQMGQIVSWNRMSHLQWWTTPQANLINGTDGTCNHPFWSRNVDAYLFNPMACRSVILEYEKDTTVRAIPVWKYSFTDRIFMNGSVYPPNAGFCLPDIQTCLPTGLLNASHCLKGAPVVMSLPHFLYGDKEKVQDLIYGLCPDPKLHNSYFNVEPYSGAILEADMRIQINLNMEKFPQIKQMKNLPTVYYPVMWADMGWAISNEKDDLLRTVFIIPLLVSRILKWSLIAVGAVVLTAFMAVYFKRPSLRNGSINSTYTDMPRQPLLS